ncbi:HAD family hydrolase [Pseudomonas matsuisoli]|uniref:Haloacid dehalogenase n=1 Tax=Pseudomonas matsuisoli TaxID=1515666 RepID=A0A917UZE2_9PSED|nr:HAD family hydrolase [Pseudomonas matsuisoli]GGK00322.1 haloacid dehalogenase [Pseudomonas matsuisoli]
MKCADIRHWVFDMDGTLTVAVHDFAAIKRHLDIPAEDDILHHLAALPETEQAAKHAWLLEHERALAEASTAATGAVELVRYLCERGDQIGILTRNAHELALITLEAIGLADCFSVEDVLGRADAPPKPHPGGLLHLAERWGVETQNMVMIGDHLNDLACAHAAGARSILVNLPHNPWPEFGDAIAQDCREIQAWVARG